MTSKQVGEIESGASTDPQLRRAERDLRAKLRAVKTPDDHTQMAQAYEVYAESGFYLAMKARGLALERTPGTGKFKQQRPDFVHTHVSGKVYFEVKALEIADPMFRHREIAEEALANAAELNARAREPGVHIGKPQAVYGHLPGATAAERIHASIERLSNVIKIEQIEFGPTVLVVDLGRLRGMPQAASGLLPVFFQEGVSAESCVSGELWQIALGVVGERIFVLPDFDGKSNLGEHQGLQGILLGFPGLMAITFLLPGWNARSKLYTIWNAAWDRSSLKHKCTLTDSELGELLFKYSDGLNDNLNELGWRYRVIRLGSRPKKKARLKSG